MEDFATVKANAWSLPPGEEPTGMTLLFVEETAYGTFRYYHDKTSGEYRYTSSRTDAFHRQMQEQEKERRKHDRENQRMERKNRGRTGAGTVRGIENRGQAAAAGYDSQTADSECGSGTR